MRVACDVGGTFTDLVYLSEASRGDTPSLKTVKVDSTPPNFDQGVIDAISTCEIGLSECEYFIHGTTYIINTISERKGAKTALITTRGFRDVLEIARGNRPALFDLRAKKAKPFVPRHLRKVVTERLNYKGEVVVPLALSELIPIVEYFKNEGVQAIAVCLLHSYANPIHEIEIEREIGRLWPDVIVVTSHSITKQWREYERSNTTVLSAYVTPGARTYLKGLQRQLQLQGLPGSAFITKSNGGVDTLENAQSIPITILESGPASGMLGATALGERIGERNILALDVGGTTAKCSLIERGRARIISQYWIEKTPMYPGYPVLIPGLDIVEIGQGGGSIAWIDEHGGLHVGPRSAGAVPGPAAYGRGGQELTTTDANLLTGLIDPDFFIGGRRKADMDAVHRAAKALGDRLGLSTTDTARGVIRFANEDMVNALKLVSLNRGYDPRDFTLIAFGGGGGLHAAALARELRIPKVIVPTNSAVFSAFGMLLSDQRRDYLKTRIVPLDEANSAAIEEEFEHLERQAQVEFRRDSNTSVPEINFERYVDVRYEGQENTVKVSFPAGKVLSSSLEAVRSEFTEFHKREYTYTLNNPIELVTFHLAALKPIPYPNIPLKHGTGRPLKNAIKGRRRVDYDVEGVHESVVYDRDLLEHGHEFDGPAVIEDTDSTIAVLPSNRVEIDELGNVHIFTTQSYASEV
jgi:N-methylhydantoinase A